MLLPQSFLGLGVTVSYGFEWFFLGRISAITYGFRRDV